MRRRRRPTVLLGLLVLLLAGVVGGYWYERPLLRTGTGYAAHNACAVTFIAGRGRPESDLPPNPLVPVLTTRVTDGEASTSIAGLLARQSATYDRATGCTLGGVEKDPDPAPIPPFGADPLESQAVPKADPATEALLDEAFGDDLTDAARADLGTRAVVVVEHGRVVAERYADGFTRDTPQLGWSMTKSVTNLLTGRLVLEGTVKVTDAGLRPEWTDDRSRITVDDLLRMTSGLAWDETYDLGTPITRMLYDERDMGAFVASQRSAHPVGTYQQYSSGSTTLLCSVLGAKTGASTSLVPSRLLAPLGLRHAVMETDGVGNPVCSSYLWATPREWAAIGQFALQDGVWEGRRLLPEGWMRESTTVKAVAASEEVGYASSWWVNRLPDGTLVQPSLPADTYWMQGHDGQRVFVVPSAGLVVVRLGFSPAMSGRDPAVVPLVAALASTRG